MDFNKMTERVRSVIQAAQTLALRRNHQQLKPEHLLKAILDDEDGLAKRLLRNAGATPELVEQAIDAAIAKIPSVEGSGS